MVNLWKREKMEKTACVERREKRENGEFVETPPQLKMVSGNREKCARIADDVTLGFIVLTGASTPTSCGSGSACSGVFRGGALGHAPSAFFSPCFSLLRRYTVAW